jgi:hypothetical protein
MVLDMRVHGMLIEMFVMAKECKYGLMALSMKVIGRTTKLMVEGA